MGIINNSPNALEINELDCSDTNSCAGASFTVGGSNGVYINNCECGDEGGCDDTTGLPAICDNIAVTTAPVTPSPTAAPEPITPAPVTPVTPAPVTLATPAPVAV